MLVLENDRIEDIGITGKENQLYSTFNFNW